jgi:hypothetical protein
MGACAAKGVVKSVPTSIPAGTVQRVDTDGPRSTTDGYAGQPRSIAMTQIVKDALLRHYGTLKAAAITMGDMDQAQLTRDLDSGKFKFERLELCDLAAKAAVCRALDEHFGNAGPKARVKQLIRKIRRDLEELDELSDRVA